MGLERIKALDLRRMRWSKGEVEFLWQPNHWIYWPDIEWNWPTTNLRR